MRTKLLWLGWIVCIGAVLVGVQIDYGPAVGDLPGVSWLWSSGKPTRAILVRESSDPLALTAQQTAWIMSPKLRAECKAAGVELWVCDPDQTDRDGKTPADLLPAIERAKVKGVPRLILVGSRGGITDFVVPADEAAARARILGVK